MAETESGGARSWSINRVATVVAHLLLGQFKLPGWLLLLVAIYMGVPDWNTRNEYWLNIAKSSGGLMSPIASILLWPYFAPALALTGLLYVVAVGRPWGGASAPSRSPIIGWAGWIAFAICFATIAATIASGAVEAYIRTQIAEGIAGVPRGSPDENNPTKPQRPLMSENRILQPDQTRLLLEEMPSVKALTSMIFIASVPENTETYVVSEGYQDVFSRSGVIPQRMQIYPRGPDDHGVLIMVHDINAIPPAAEKLRDIMEIANVHPKIVDGADKYIAKENKDQFILFIAPAPIT
jgi:hypothetical protein